MLHAGEHIADQRVALFIACLSVHDVLVCLFEGTRRAVRISRMRELVLKNKSKRYAAEQAECLLILAKRDRQSWPRTAAPVHSIS